MILQRYYYRTFIQTYPPSHSRYPWFSYRQLSSLLLLLSSSLPLFYGLRWFREKALLGLERAPALLPPLHPHSPPELLSPWIPAIRSFPSSSPARVPPRLLPREAPVEEEAGVMAGAGVGAGAEAGAGVEAEEGPGRRGRRKPCPSPRPTLRRPRSRPCVATPTRPPCWP